MIPVETSPLRRVLYKKWTIFFFGLYLICGLFLFSDYGISWDEEPCRIELGLVNYNAIFHNGKNNLLKSEAKYHGPAYELVLITIERVLPITDTRTVYLMRHLISFMVFYVSSIFIFLSSLKIFKEYRWAWISILLYVLSPRLFAESFYNSKDLPFLSFFSISLFTLIKFLEKKNLKWLIIHAAITGFMIDIRILGIIMPLVTAVLLLIGFFRDNQPKKAFLKLPIYILVQFAFVLLFWPVLWDGPFFHLYHAFIEMKKFPQYSAIRYLGEIITADRLPWHYLPLWMLISIPLASVFLWTAGVISSIFYLSRFNLRAIKERKYDLLFLFFFFFPILSVVLLHSVVYDGWRHLYFISAPMVFISTRGAKSIFEELQKIRFKKLPLELEKGFLVLLFCSFLPSAFAICKNHPNENVYFNIAAEKIFNPIRNNFELDYWGLSYRQALEAILKNDTAAEIHICVEHFPGNLNTQILTPDQRNRLVLHENIAEADYYLADFRDKLVKPETLSLEIIQQIKNSSGILLTIYKGERSSTEGKRIFNYECSFDDSLSDSNITDKVFYSKPNCFNLKNFCGTNIRLDSVIRGIRKSELNEAHIEGMIRVETINPEVLVVFSINRGEKNIYWTRKSLQNILMGKKWMKVSANFSIPNSIIAGDIGWFSFWNVDGSLIFVDDLKVTITKYYTKNI
jgi:hypothetical protein